MLFIGCLKWAAVGFVVASILMLLYEATHIHDDIPKPEFKKRQSRRATGCASSCRLRDTDFPSPSVPVLMEALSADGYSHDRRHIRLRG